MLNESDVGQRAQPGAVPLARIERWYDAHGPALLGLAYRMLGDPRLSERVVTDVFVRAFQHGESWPDERAASELLRDTQRRAASHLRAARQAEAPLEVGPDDPTPSHRKLREAACFDGYTVEELCECFEMRRSDVLAMLKASLQSVCGPRQHVVRRGAPR